jgi:hypothetical protein
MTAKFKAFLREEAWLYWGDYQALVHGNWPARSAIEDDFVNRMWNEADRTRGLDFPDDGNAAEAYFIKILRSSKKPQLNAKRNPTRKNPDGVYVPNWLVRLLPRGMTQTPARLGVTIHPTYDDVAGDRLNAAQSAAHRVVGSGQGDVPGAERFLVGINDILRGARRNPTLSSKERVILRTLGKDLEDLGFPATTDFEDFIKDADIPTVQYLRLVKKDVGPHGHGWHNVGPGDKPKWDEFWRREKHFYATQAEGRNAFSVEVEDWNTEAEPYYEAAKLVDAAINRLLAKE